jgi:ATP-dependent NAD(P)H-hydrate dehydratase
MIRPISSIYVARLSLASWAYKPIILSSYILLLSGQAPTSVFSLALRRTSTRTSSMLMTSRPPNDTVMPQEWSDILRGKNESFNTDRANALFPPLSSAAHKGSHGRIAIFGGSEKYTGAPYYAASAALNCGVDLVTIFCAKEASIPIKCYSPELMVQSVYSVEELDDIMRENALLNDKLENEKDTEQIQLLDEQQVLLKTRQKHTIQTTIGSITASFPSLHTLCVGPGLGRHELLFPVVRGVLEKAMKCNLALVLDADALYMLSLGEYRDLLKRLLGYENVVMTPNLMEWKRLKEALNKEEHLRDQQDNVGILVQKGGRDIITQQSMTLQCKEQGGLKRSGGIGDVLAGTISAFMAWNAVLSGKEGRDEKRQLEDRILAAWTACCVVKKATRKSFDRKRRSMSAQHVLEEIGEVVREMEQELEK